MPLGTEEQASLLQLFEMKVCIYAHIQERAGVCLQIVCALVYT